MTKANTRIILKLYCISSIITYQQLLLLFKKYINYSNHHEFHLHF